MAVLGLAMTIASCSSDLVEEKTNTTEKQQMVFTATYEDTGETTRTALNGTKVEWKSGDAVAVWDGTQINSFTAEPLSDATTASLSGSVTKGSSSYVAVYPYSLGKDWCEYSEDEIKYIIIPSEQTATLGSFDPDAAIMVAKSDANNNFAFKNVCSFLKITTAEEYQKIVVTTNDGTLAGYGSCTNATEPTFTVWKGYSNSQVTLQPRSGSSTIAKGTYYIAIAPGTLEGLTVDCYTSTGYAEKSTSKKFTTSRSKSYDLGSTENWTKYYAYSVSDTKKVIFTKGNLYWNGSESAYHIESSQIGSSRDTDGYPDITNANHVSYFYWTNLADYKSGKAEYMPYTSTSKFDHSTLSVTDQFWCGESNKLTVDSKSDLYVLSNSEWRYLINSRKNAASLYKFEVKVTDGSNIYEHCIIIAPDSYDFTTNPLKEEYSLTEVNNLNLTCLPAVGDIYELNGKHMFHTTQKDYGCYWTSTPGETELLKENAYDFYFTSTYVSTQYDESSSLEHRSYAHCIRLVWTFE